MITTYLGYPVLDITAYESIEHGPQSSFTVLGDLYQAQKKRNISSVEERLIYKTVHWTLAERATLRTFFDARRGMLDPFWVLSKKYDIVLPSTTASASPTIVIENHDRIYSFLAAGNRHLYSPILDAGFKVTDYSLTENDLTLTLSPSLTGTLVAGSFFYHFFFVRFNQDRIDFVSTDKIPDGSETELEFLELQRQTP